jgi:hypothetical protein
VNGAPRRWLYHSSMNIRQPETCTWYTTENSGSQVCNRCACDRGSAASFTGPPASLETLKHDKDFVFHTAACIDNCAGIAVGTHGHRHSACTRTRTRTSRDVVFVTGGMSAKDFTAGSCNQQISALLGTLRPFAVPTFLKT